MLIARAWLVMVVVRGQLWRIRDAARWLLPGIAALVLVACGGSADPAQDGAQPIPTRTLIPPTVTPTPEPQPRTPTPTDLPGPAALLPAGDVSGAEPFTPRALIARALDHLVTTHDVTADDVRLMSLDAFTWHDDTWGCENPEPVGDRAPADDAATVPGFRVVFYAGNRAFVYHTDEYGAMLACEDSDWLDLAGEPVPVEPIAEAMVDLSRRDAVRRLEVTPDDLKLASLVTLTWPDASVGCPKPGVDYADRETPGYRIVFGVNDAHVIYHTSVKDVVFCTLEEEILPDVLRRALAGAGTDTDDADRGAAPGDD